ncbi:MAG TPA: sulfatase-like hydrolase/transferase [Thermoleophilaceae bacterium]|nr:sulfatase-like hydrolase/transferase [Thermoleophilaceae bacterium]
MTDAGVEGDRSPGAVPKRTGDDPPRQPPGVLLSFLHLAVLSAFALAQPLFNLLSDNPEFFAARGSTAMDIIVFAVLLVVLPPAVLLAIELLIGLAGPKARLGAHLVLMALLAGIVFVQALKDAFGASDFVLIAIALALGAGAAALYARAEPVRSFLTVLSPAPLVFLILFLFISPVSKITLADDASAKSIDGIEPIPVVMVVFDEFPGISLLDAKGEVDPVRYPGFAQLAKDGAWFPNAHSIYDSTSKAVPAIMDGDYPEKGVLPTSSEHPNSIFALLGKSHTMNVSEEATTVCPRDLCEDARLDEPFLDRLGSMTEDVGLVYAHVVAPPDIEADLPSVSETWGEFGGEGSGHGEISGDVSVSDDEPTAKEGKQATLAALKSDRNEKFDAWISAIQKRPRPSLNFKHALLPHVPWKYLPTGQQYNTAAGDPIPGLSRQSYPDATQVEQLQMRHLLQLGYADLKIQQLIAHLKKIGIYDEALVVVTADHGVAFQQGLFDRRKAKPATLAEISPVPLFIKLPGQKRGRVNPAIVETTDIVPTISDVLNIDVPDETDGKSAFSAAVAKRDEVKMLPRDFSDWMRVDGDAFAAEKQKLIDRKIALFGSGADGPDRIYRVGPNQELVGKSVASLPTGGASDAKVALTDPGAYDDVDLNGPVLPVWVTGKVSGSDDRVDVAIAVNGVVRAVSNTFKLATGGDELIAAMIPPRSLRDGRNTVEVYEVTDSGAPALMGGTD